MKKLLSYAAESGLDVDAFRQCIESGTFKGAIEHGVRDAREKGLRGTPTFVVGKSTPTGVDGEVVIGAVPFGVFEKKIRELK